MHRCNRYLNNRIEQDHRGMKQRYYPMRGFGNVESATRFCRACEEVRQFFRFRTSMKQQVSLAHQRDVFRQRLDALKTMVPLASHRGMQRKELAVGPCVLSSDTSPEISID